MLLCSASQQYTYLSALSTLLAMAVRLLSEGQSMPYSAHPASN